MPINLDRNVRIDGVRCVPTLWSRFSLEKTVSEGGQKLYRELILNDTISWTVEAPHTHRDVVEQIARNCTEPIPVDSLADDLNAPRFSRGATIYGFPGNTFAASKAVE